jgi:hypothetical protein
MLANLDIFPKTFQATLALRGKNPVETRVARFFLVQIYKTWKNIPNDHKLYQKGHELYQMTTNYTKKAINYTNIFPSKALQNLPELGFLV